jgi:hypothetical protein
MSTKSRAVIGGLWDAAGIVDDWWGRARVLAAFLAGLGGALIFVWFFALERVGGWGIALLVFALFCCVLGAGTLLAVKRKEPTAPDVDDPAERLSDELRAGHEIRKRARMARGGTEELFEACEEFIKWANGVDEQVLAVAPEDFAGLPQRAPWSIHGKGEALKNMDARLAAYSRLVMKLRGSPATSPLGKTGLSDAEIEGLEKRYWAIKAEEKHQELSALLESGLDLRAQIEKLQNDPLLTTTRAAFSVSQWPQKIHTWLKRGSAVRS